MLLLRGWRVDCIKGKIVNKVKIVVAADFNMITIVALNIKECFHRNYSGFVRNSVVKDKFFVYGSRSSNTKIFHCYSSIKSR